MRTALVLVIASGLAAAGCTHSDESQMPARADVARAEAAAEHVNSLYPPLQKDAADEHVHEYY